MMAYARANGSTLAENPISPERNSKFDLFSRLWEKTESMMKPMAGLNCEANVLFAAVSCGWMSARIIRLSSSTSTVMGAAGAGRAGATIPGTAGVAGGGGAGGGAGGKQGGKLS